MAGRAATGVLEERKEVIESRKPVDGSVENGDRARLRRGVPREDRGERKSAVDACVETFPADQTGDASASCDAPYNVCVFLVGLLKSVVVGGSMAATRL